MSQGSRQDENRLGFLTAVEVPNRGFVGGLLVTNRFGRPLEFQCTAPVRPNRTQAILYGPTLRPYLLGELIGKTLINRVDVKPHLVFTEQADMLEVRRHIAVPVAMITGDEIRSISPVESASAETESRPTPNALQVRSRDLRFHRSHLEDREQVRDIITAIPREMDLREPFERIREALNETLQAEAA